MPAAVRPYVTAGVALVGASVISVTPVIAPSVPDIRVASPAVSLAAWSDAPVNMFNLFLNAPAAHIAGINRLATGLEDSKSWWVYSDVNVLGWDEPNFNDMTPGFVEAMVPFTPLSNVYRDHMTWWLAANLPMHQGCSGLPPCADPAGMLGSMFTVPFWEFFDGHTFGVDDPTPANNPISEEETEWSHELGQTGAPVPWYGQTVTIDPNAGWNALMAYLSGEQSEVTSVSFQDAVAAYTRLGQALWNSWNPFVPQSYIWNPQYTISAYLFRPFARVLCPQCNPIDPYLPPEWRPGDPVPEGFDYPVPPPPDAPAQTVTVDVAALRADSGTEAAPVNAQQDGLVDASTEIPGNEEKSGNGELSRSPVAATATTAESTVDEKLITVQEEVAPSEAESGLDIAIDATPNLEESATPDVAGSDGITPNVPWIERRESFKAEPGQTGPKHRMPSGGGLTGVVKSVQDTISSVTGGFNRADGSGAGDIGTDNTGEQG